jgi:hypothetical protein
LQYSIVWHVFIVNKLIARMFVELHL